MLTLSKGTLKRKVAVGHNGIYVKSLGGKLLDQRYPLTE